MTDWSKCHNAEIIAIAAIMCTHMISYRLQHTFNHFVNKLPSFSIDILSMHMYHCKSCRRVFIIYAAAEPPTNASNAISTLHDTFHTDCIIHL